MIIRNLLLGAVALTTAAAPLAASAQDWRRGDRDGRHQRWDRRDGYRGDSYRGDRYRSNRYYGQRYSYAPNYYSYGYAQPYYYGGYQPYYGGGYYNQSRWYRGAVLPYNYRRSWYIDDYYRYGYSRPPRGYGYYRTNTGDIVLAALATGVILSIIGR